MTKFILETQSGCFKEMPDHTQWFFNKFNGNFDQILIYYSAVIKSACSKHHAGSMENIKKLARYDNFGRCLETLVLDGKRM